MTDKPRGTLQAASPERLADGLAFDLDRALKSIVTIQSSIPEDAYTAQTLGEHRSGSGVVIRDSGLVLTIGYLITEAETVWLARADGRVVPGHALAIDQESGFGLVQALDRLDCPTLEFGRSGEARIGDPVVVAAGGGTKAVHASIVGKQEFAGYWEYFLDEAIFTAPAHPFWGGASAIGARRPAHRRRLAARRTADRAGRAARHQYDRADRPLAADPRGFPDLWPGQQAARPWLGIYSAESDGEVVVAAVADRGPAAAAGLRRGDILASVRGAEIADLGDFYRKVWTCGDAGVEVPIEVIRDGRALGLTIKSADRAEFLKRPRLQ